MEKTKLTWRQTQDEVIDDFLSLASCIKGFGSKQSSKETADIYYKEMLKENELPNWQALYEISEIIRETKILLYRMVRIAQSE